jgi:hypothetical protein
LGITNYHRHFTKDYAKTARPLHDLTKDVLFALTETQSEAFEALKQALVTRLVLALPKDKGRFRLETDASDVATGAVLSQEQEDGSYRPLGFVSKSFSEAEQWYTTYNKELLRIMRALDD